MAIELNFAIIWDVKTGYAIEECSLTGTVWTDNTGYGVFFNLQVEFINCDQAAECFRHVFCS